KRGATRNVVFDVALLEPDAVFRRTWARAWSTPLPQVLWTTHPSAQNMSPFARTETLFHTRMLETRAALQKAAGSVLGIEPPQERPEPAQDGIYALPEWRERVAPHHERLDKLWRGKGVRRKPLLPARVAVSVHRHGLLRSHSASPADPDRARPPRHR